MSDSSRRREEPKDQRISESVKERTARILRIPTLAELPLCAALLAVSLVGCHADNPCPVSMMNHSTHALYVDVCQDSLFEMYWQEFYLASPDSGFVGYYPRGTVLWFDGGIGEVRASDTSRFGDKPVAVTIIGKTTLLFSDDSLGAPLLRVIR
jgi:hypothetical protein